MKITDIEIIPIYPRIAERNAAYTPRFHDMNHLTVFKVHTEAGVVGYGEFRCTPPPRAYVEPLIGRSPFDFINNTFNPGLGGALYDVMGKYLDVPAYKLMGQKVRDARVGCGLDPDRFAGAIRGRGATRGSGGLHDLQDAHLRLLRRDRADPSCAGGRPAGIPDSLRFQLQPHARGGATDLSASWSSIPSSATSRTR